MNTKLYEILRIDMGMIQDDATCAITQKEISKNKILIRESDIVRIVLAFNPQNSNVGNSKKYPFIKDLILLKVGKSYNRYYRVLCGEGKKEREKQDIGVFTITGLEGDNGPVRYKRILCGSSFIRNAKELYIRESMYDAAMKVLLTGIPPSMMYPAEKKAKYSTYMGLAATDSLPVSMPKICVVKDCTKKIHDKFDVVKQIRENDGKYKYEVKNYKEGETLTEEEINCFDGAGLVSYGQAKRWSGELGLNYVPVSWQIRVLSGIKGNLYTFPVKEYIEQLGQQWDTDTLTITDLWGKEVDINDIDVFLTASQFKFAGLYKSFEEWNNSFMELVEYNGNGFTRTFNISEVSVAPEKLEDEVQGAYQPLQTLEIPDDGLKALAEPTIQRVRGIYSDLDEFLKYRGVNDPDDDRVPWYYRAMLLDDSLRFDPYIRKKMNADLESLRNRVYQGKILLEGNYQVLTPDLLALMEHICGQEVKGALNAGEVYSAYWLKKEVQKISIWRNPAIACEWSNVGVVKNGDTDRWLKYQGTGIVTNIYDTLAMRAGTADFDGDTVAGVHSQIIHNAVEKADIHTIKFEPHTGEEKGEPKFFRIDDQKELMGTNKLGFQNNIGEITNKVTVLWSKAVSEKDGQKKEKLMEYIKILSVINQLTIDFVKTGMKVPVPEDIQDEVKKLPKPNFLGYKNHGAVKDKTALSNLGWFGYALEGAEGVPEYQPHYCLSEGTVDRLSSYLESTLGGLEAEYLNTGQKCQFTKLLEDRPYIYNATYPKLKEKYGELKGLHDELCGMKYYGESQGGMAQDDLMMFRGFYDYCEFELLKICRDEKKLLDYMIYLNYFDGEYAGGDKAILWNVFGERICRRYQNGEICTEEETLGRMQRKEKRMGKTLQKLKEQKDATRKVKIKGIPDNVVMVSDSDIKYVEEGLSDDVLAQRLMLVLVVLDRKLNMVDGEKVWQRSIIIKRGRNDLTINKLCKLADISYKQIFGKIRKLYDCGLISLNLDNPATVKINVTPFCAGDTGGYVIGDINEISDKIFKPRMFFENPKNQSEKVLEK